MHCAVVAHDGEQRAGPPRVSGRHKSPERHPVARAAELGAASRREARAAAEHDDRVDATSTNSHTVCPSGLRGPCTPSAWAREALPSVCCDPRLGVCGPDSPTSAACTQSCQCESASCVAGACEAR